MSSSTRSPCGRATLATRSNMSPQNSGRGRSTTEFSRKHEGESAHHPARCSLGAFVANLFGSRRQLEVENLFLRHQLNVVLRDPPHRLRLRGSDRALLVWMTWLWPTRASFSLTRSCAGIAQGFGPITRSARKAQS